METISIQLTSLGWPLALLLTAGCIAAAVWYYTGMTPPAAGWKKRLLAGLRATALVLLLIGFVEPVFSLVMSVTSRRNVAVLLDTSSSMRQAHDPARERDALRTVETVRDELGDGGLAGTFDAAAVVPHRDTPDFTGRATDIARAVRETSARSDVASVILISDGRWNTGTDPAMVDLERQVPVHTVLVGETPEVHDVIVERVSVPTVGHDGVSQPVEVTVTTSTGTAGTFPLRITENGVVVSATDITLGGDETARASLELTPAGPGTHTYTAAVGFEGDDNPENNSRTFTVHVLKNSFRVLLVAPHPSADFSFLVRTLEEHETFELDTVLGNPATPDVDASVPADAGNYDAYIILNGGGAALTPMLEDGIIGSVRNGAGLFVAGTTRIERFDPLLGISPSSAQAVSSGDINLSLTEVGHTHTITTSAGGDGVVSGWDNLPPVPAGRPFRIAGSSLRSLAVIGEDATAGNTVMAAGKVGAGKVLVLSLSGFWRWRLMLAGQGGSRTLYSDFVNGALRWLTSDLDSSPLAVTTGGERFLSGEPVPLEARLYDNVYAPITGADIRVEVDDLPSRRIFLDETSPAVYTGEFASLPPGEHAFTARAYRGGNLVAEDTGSFTVEDMTLEEIQTAPSPETMRALAVATGGMSITPGGIDSLLAVVEPSTVSRRESREEHPYLHPLLPVIILAVLAAEWGIRKRSGMI